MNTSAPGTAGPATGGTPAGEAAACPAPEVPGLPGQSATTVGSCDLVTVPSRHGLEAVDILRRGAPEAVGPVLHDDDHDTLSFCVPVGTADAWDVPGSDCTHSATGSAAGAPLAFQAEQAAQQGWLLPAEAADPVTDPAVLRVALGEAARIIEAADSCR